MAIYIPSGGISTKDATAIPADVASGKIFYNAEGRQVGSGKMIKKIIMPKRSGSYTSGTIRDGYRYRSSDGYRFGSFMEFDDNLIAGHYNGVNGIGHIIGVDIDGIYTTCPSVSTGCTCYTYRNGGYDYPWFYHYGTWVYYARIINGQEIPSNVRNRQITIYYVDE